MAAVAPRYRLDCVGRTAVVVMRCQERVQEDGGVCEAILTAYGVCPRQREHALPPVSGDGSDTTKHEHGQADDDEHEPDPRQRRTAE